MSCTVANIDMMGKRVSELHIDNDIHKRFGMSEFYYNHVRVRVMSRWTRPSSWCFVLLKFNGVILKPFTTRVTHPHCPDHPDGTIAHHQPASGRIVPNPKVAARLLGAQNASRRST